MHFLDRVWLYKGFGYAQSPDVQVHSFYLAWTSLGFDAIFLSQPNLFVYTEYY